MKKTLLILGLAFAAVACGPSDAELKQHEEAREEQNQELEEDWEAEMDDLLNDSI